MFQFHSGSIQTAPRRTFEEIMRSFNSTLVRFKPEDLENEGRIKVTVSIPLWFDSNQVIADANQVFFDVSIPLWFDSNWPNADPLPCPSLSVSIPLWFDSNLPSA